MSEVVVWVVMFIVTLAGAAVFAFVFGMLTASDE